MANRHRSLEARMPVLFLLLAGSGFATKAVFGTELTWTAKAPLSIPTYHLSVAVGPDGKIYGFGGGQPGVTATTQVYDPITDTSAMKTSMPTPKAGNGAVLSGSKLYAIGGYSGWGVLNVNEEYDPITDTWATMSPMPTRRYMVGATGTTDGKIWVIGGQTDDPDAGGAFANGWYLLNKLEMYDPSTEMWNSKASMPSYRQGLAAVTLNGKLYAMGGYTALPSFATTTVVEEYNPTTDTWTQKASLNRSRAFFAAAVSNGRIYVSGGVENVNGTEEWLQSVEEYDPTTDTWTTIGNLPIPLAGVAAAAPNNGSFYILGGCDNQFALVDTIYKATPMEPILDVVIDVKPGSFPNTINLGSGGSVPVAVLSKESFDATSIDPLTVTLASAPARLKGKGTPMKSFEDVNGDGYLDLVVHIETEALLLSEFDTAVQLTAMTFEGMLVQGNDSVRVVP